MKYLAALLWLTLFAYAEMNATVQKNLPEPKEVQHKPDFIYKKEGWELKIWYTAKGSRSEGTFGKLYHNGKEVLPKKGGEELQTPFGKLYFVISGPLWEAHGWRFSEEDKGPPPSWQEK